MNSMLLGLYVKFEKLASLEEGQDMVEYAMVLALIALLSIASLRAAANSISTDLSLIDSAFSSAV
jgi:Flp pilus assembly pilin Flp